MFKPYPGQSRCMQKQNGWECQNYKSKRPENIDENYSIFHTCWNLRTLSPSRYKHVQYVKSYSYAPRVKIEYVNFKLSYSHTMCMYRCQKKSQPLFTLHICKYSIRNVKLTTYYLEIKSYFYFIPHFQYLFIYFFDTTAKIGRISYNTMLLNFWPLNMNCCALWNT